VSRLSPTGSSLIYSTYLGGAESDRAYGIALDSEGSAYIVGETRSSDFPSPGVTFGTVNQTDAFIVQLSTPMDFWLASAEPRQ
jgi:hypothetical protein